MHGSKPSTTAKMTAIARGLHRIDDAYPWVLDDPFALPLVGPEWSQIFAVASKRFSPRVMREARAFTVARSRFAEDRLLNGSLSQCVLLGAGLDSFGWRRPDLLSSTRLIEVDHPGTQEWKRDRAAAMGLPIHDRHVFAPVDFEVDDLPDRLHAAGFERSAPAMFSWLGVVAYLTPEAIAETLKHVADCSPASEIVMSYPPAPAFVDQVGMEFRESLAPIAASAGEPVLASMTPSDFEDLVRSCGLEVVEHLTREQLHDRYFAGRSDGLTPYTNERLLAAVVPR